MNTFTSQTISIQQSQSNLLLFLALIVIPNLCMAQISTSTTSSPTPAPTHFYEDLNTLKYIAIAALLVLICCCLALIIFVRRQVRKTEQGTEIQQYIRKKKESSDINGAHHNALVSTSDINGGKIPKLSYDQSNTYTQTQTNTINNTHTMNGNGSNADLYGHNGHGSNLNVLGQPQSFPNAAISLDSTPGEHLNRVEEEADIKKEIQIIKMAEQQKFRERMKDADKREQIEDFKEEDKEFIGDLKYNIERLHSEENKLFNEMERENLKNKQMQQMQQANNQGRGNGYY